MPTPYKLIIAGGRDFNDRTMFDEGLQWFAQDAAPVKFVDPSGVDDGAVLEIVSGMAKGADSLGAEYAQEVGIPLHKFPANWKDLEAPGAVVRQGPYGAYNVNAGFDRNRRMAEAANGVLLYPGGKGTAHMAQIAQELGLDVFDYRDPAKPVVLRAAEAPPMDAAAEQLQLLESITPPVADGPAPVEESVMAGKRWPLVLAAAGGLTALGAGVYMAQNDKKATGVSVPVA